MLAAADDEGTTVRSTMLSGDVDRGLQRKLKGGSTVVHDDVAAGAQLAEDARPRRPGCVDSLLGSWPSVSVTHVDVGPVPVCMHFVDVGNVPGVLFRCGHSPRLC